MDINATFIGQIIVFLILLWFIYKVVTPMLAGPIGERQEDRRRPRGRGEGPEGPRRGAGPRGRAGSRGA